MAVPKKRISSSKKRIRKNIWKGKGSEAALKALSLAKSISTGNSKSFESKKHPNPKGDSHPRGFGLFKKIKPNKEGTLVSIYYFLDPYKEGTLVSIYYFLDP
nr:ribosomal protein L32 [Geranium palmatum]YP_009250268.1 ribosomal protein L32 [Geranium maderense]ADJ66417.1 ribosomal protein L32 [Geranium palmatum]AMY96096.1 ribosomal protein L32 [Geranium maderense]